MSDKIDLSKFNEPPLETFFPSIQEDIERYGRAWFNQGLRTGLRPANQMMVWLTCKPPISHKKLREFLQKEIDAEEAKFHKQ